MAPVLRLLSLLFPQRMAFPAFPLFTSLNSFSRSSYADLECWEEGTAPLYFEGREIVKNRRSIFRVLSNYIRTEEDHLRSSA